MHTYCLIRFPHYICSLVVNGNNLIDWPKNSKGFMWLMFDFFVILSNVMFIYIATYSRLTWYYTSTDSLFIFQNSSYAYNCAFILSIFWFLVKCHVCWGYVGDYTLRLPKGPGVPIFHVCFLSYTAAILLWQWWNTLTGRTLLWQDI